MSQWPAAHRSSEEQYQNQQHHHNQHQQHHHHQQQPHTTTTPDDIFNFNSATPSHQRQLSSQSSHLHYPYTHSPQNSFSSPVPKKQSTLYTNNRLASPPKSSPPQRNLSQSSINRTNMSTPTPKSPNWTSLIPPMPSHSEPTFNLGGGSNNSSNGNLLQQSTTPPKNTRPPIHSRKSLSNGGFESFHSTTVGQQTPPRNGSYNDSVQQRTVSPRPQRRKKVCKGCGKEISGQFVRALNSAFHVECFCCHECGTQCSSKFFPHEITNPETNDVIQVALCEFHYFQKLDLICYNCNCALRGPYITALGFKYHLEHFTCSVCHKVFESDESFYEHENAIYCHYHYSKLHASHCEGCHSAIVKQFVELYRGGRNQQWHPECYMVHKFWNVSVTADCVGSSMYDSINLTRLSDSNLSAHHLVDVEQKIESTVMKCWFTLSGYEEATAACISDMLLHACTANRSSGLVSTGKLVLNIELLFIAIDSIFESGSKIVTALPTDEDNEGEQERFLPLRKEPRNLSGKIMSYLAILRKSKSLSTGSLSVDLLSVITGCAHYLKLLIRNGLNNALRANKYNKSTAATDKFIDYIRRYEKLNNNSDDSQQSDRVLRLLTVSSNASDSCPTCEKSIETRCVKFNDKRWHFECMKCSNCNELIGEADVPEASYNSSSATILCANCSFKDPEAKTGFKKVTDLSQLVFLLKIALIRSRSVMARDNSVRRSQKSLTRRDTTGNKSAFINDDSMITINENEARKQDYSQTLTDVTRLRSTRQDQKLRTSVKQNARKSYIIEAPEAAQAEQLQGGYNTPEGETEGEGDSSGVYEDAVPFNTMRQSSVSSGLSFTKSTVEDNLTRAKRNKSLRIREEEPPRANSKGGSSRHNLDRTSDLLKNEKSLTLDDIPRIVAAEQAREHRPNAFRHHNSLNNNSKKEPVARTVMPTSDVSGGGAGHNGSSTPSSGRGKYYSELTKEEHFIMRHIAIEALSDLINGNTYNVKISKDYLLSSIVQSTKKQSSNTFWNKFKFGSSGGSSDSKHADRTGASMNVFGSPLDDLTKRYGVESDLGVGPSKLRIPIVIDDCITAMRQKDMSVEGIFRLNGNIKKLRELTEVINMSPERSPDFSLQTAIQLAALIKKWLRELPDPLLTFNLYDVWIGTQKVTDPVVQKRMLQLAYCLLPRSHRDLVEVLLYFFSWVTSFAEIDEVTGSKMDTHNLATVITPNILVSKPAGGVSNVKSNSSGYNPPPAFNDANVQSSDDYFLGIEVVNQLIESHDELCCVPEDLMKFYSVAGFDKTGSAVGATELSTKEILSRCESTLRSNGNFFRDNIAGTSSSSANGKSRSTGLMSSDTVVRHHSTNNHEYHEYKGDTVAQ